MAIKGKPTGVNFVKKGKKVGEIETLAKFARSMVFINYKGLNTAEDMVLRAKFRAADVVYKVYKNSLVKIALRNLGIADLADKLTGTLSVAFSNADEIAGAKIVKEQKFKGKMSFEFGIVGKKVLDKAEVTRLASLPGKEMLIAQIMGLINSGARGIAAAVNAVPRNLAAVVNAHAAPG
jgi:large subunit ribosomal protein L10